MRCMKWFKELFCKHEFAEKEHRKKYDRTNFGDLIELGLFIGLMTDYGNDEYGYLFAECYKCGKIRM